MKRQKYKYSIGNLYWIKLKILFIFCLIFISSTVNSLLYENMDGFEYQGCQLIVFVDDDFDENTSGWGYNHFNNIQDGINNVSELGTYGGIVLVMPGTYDAININRTCRVWGINKDTVIIDGVNSSIPIFENYLYISGQYSKTGQYWTTNMTLRKLTDSYPDYYLSVTVDDEYVYAGHYNTNRIHKFRISNMSFVGQSSVFPGEINAITVDDEYVYAGDGSGGMTGNISQYWKSNLTLKKSIDFGDKVYCLITDIDYLYASGLISVGVSYVKQYWKSNMTMRDHTADEAWAINEITLDDTYLYVASSYRGIIMQYWKSNLNKKRQSAQVTTNYGGYVAEDDLYLYEPLSDGNIVKFWKSNLSVKQMSLDYGDFDYIDIDDEYVYSETSNKVCQIWKSNLTKRAETDTFSGTVRDIAIGEDYPIGYNATVSMSANSVIIRGCTITNSAIIEYPNCNIDITGDNTQIIDCNILHNSVGIYIRGSYQTKIMQSYFSENDYGAIELKNSAHHVYIENNSMINNGYYAQNYGTVKVNECNYINIKYNEIYPEGYNGIYFNNSFYSNIDYNIIDTVDVPSDTYSSCIKIESSGNISISSNNFTDDEYCIHGYNITGDISSNYCVIEGDTGTCTYINFIEDSFILSNVFDGGTKALHIVNGENNVIYANYFMNSGYGLYLS